MRETHRGTGQDVPEDAQVSPNVNALDSRTNEKLQKKILNSILPKLGR